MGSVLVWAFWTSWGATKQNLNPAQSSWTCIRGRLYRSQCIRSAGNQGPGPQEGMGHFVDPAGFVPYVPHQAGQKRCDRQGPAQGPPGGVLSGSPSWHTESGCHPRSVCHHALCLALLTSQLHCLTRPCALIYVTFVFRGAGHC